MEPKEVTRKMLRAWFKRMRDINEISSHCHKSYWNTLVIAPLREIWMFANVACGSGDSTFDAFREEAFRSECEQRLLDLFRWPSEQVKRGDHR